MVLWSDKSNAGEMRQGILVLGHNITPFADISASLIKAKSFWQKHSEGFQLCLDISFSLSRKFSHLESTVIAHPNPLQKVAFKMLTLLPAPSPSQQ